ncbi:hypothetical protein BGW36DRAFT_424330 [Talaromyces proteolyticus]|uniref:Uncharacterized protein n=1 Tax=Talaromyces proteolyticus TaxID=1131652 RepID=A0AAD4Q3Q5_9EURO|nr:uncharacterized protein BGW36DRAFT_424330 [Talaromyces proteolyticus]KAH8702038.1 hypothetical protein BGW36DRAFT_424330 [Talaromyces proteolyticus]
MPDSLAPGPNPKPAKTMSSRLLTMKFMQRAAASAAQPTVEEQPETPSPKRPRLSAPSSPAQPLSDLEAVNAALAAEEQKRAEAITRQAAEAGESEWVLDYHGTGGSPVSAYPAKPSILAADSLDTEPQESGRRSFGNFKPKKQVMIMDPNEPDSGRKPKAEVKLHKLNSISGGRGSSGSRISGGGGDGGSGGGKKHSKSGKKRSR